jgi:hypothetical protein
MKTQKFEKVVEWDFNTENAFFFFILITPLLIWGWIIYLFRYFDGSLNLLIVYSGLFLFGIIAIILNRKVYWRKIK